jgi:molecular chaperone DnaK
MSDSNQRIFERRPVVLQVRLAFDDLGTFVERHAINISEGGIFIRSREPRPVGSRLKFSLSLRTGAVVFSGEGTVRWIRQPNEAGVGQAGMGLQFDELSAESREILAGILQGRAEARLPPPVEGASPSAWAPAPTGEGTTPTPILLPALDPPAVAPESPREAASSQLGTPAKEEPQRIGATVGIDFGWGHIRAAVALDQQVRSVRLAARGALPVLAASTKKKGLVVGEGARAAILEGAPGVRGVTQLLGWRQGSAGAHSWSQRQALAPVADESGALALPLGGAVHSVQAIVDALLKSVCEEAERQLGQPVTRAVFAVPTAWNDAQRHALRGAAERCGLQVLALVNASLAAMLALHGPTGKRKSLVVNFGEGSIESALVVQNDHIFELVQSSTDSSLGGADLDVQLLQSVLTEFEKETGYLVPEDLSIFERARAEAARAKEVLSEELDVEIQVDGLVEAGLSKAGILQRVPRARLLSLIGPLLDRAIEIVRGPLVARHVSPSELDEIVLLGGQSAFRPFVRKVAERLGREPDVVPQPTEAVVRGAALVAESADQVGRFLLAGAVGASLGYRLPDGGFRRVIDRHFPLPVERECVLTPPPGASMIELELLQGERLVAAENDAVGIATIGPLPANGRPAMRAVATFVIDDDGEIAVRAREETTGADIPVVLRRT